MEIKLEHVLLLLFVIILFCFANNVEGLYDATCETIYNHGSLYDCELNPNCVYQGGWCISKDPPAFNPQMFGIFANTDTKMFNSK